MIELFYFLSALLGVALLVGLISWLNERSKRRDWRRATIQARRAIFDRNLK